ncbi:MAG: hypothetical protein CMJ65_16735, partial [Planctomycetaceae bacterium]|nr:hypothetical protein [Planctomycetaceae bacterium]
MLLTSWLTAVKGRFGRRMRRRVRKTTPENRPTHRVGQYAESLEDRTLLSGISFEWEMEPRTVADEDGRIEIPNTTAFVNTDTFTVTLDASGSTLPSGATPLSYSWTIDDVAIPDGTDGQLEQDLTSGTHSIVVDASNGGEIESFSEDILVRDFLIVGIGDSYSSGEGSPEVTRHDLALVGQPHDLGEWAKPGETFAATDADSQIQQHQEIFHQWGHRTSFAYTPQTALMLENLDPHSSVTLVFVSQSGATVPIGGISPYAGITSEYGSTEGLVGILGETTLSVGISDSDLTLTVNDEIGTDVASGLDAPFLVRLDGSEFVLVTGVAGNTLTVAGSNYQHEFISGKPSQLTAPAGTVSGATNDSPIKITSTDHGLQTGLEVNITGVGGNTAANESFVVTVVDDDHFTLNGSTGNGAKTSDGSWIGIHPYTSVSATGRGYHQTEAEAFDAAVTVEVLPLSPSQIDQVADIVDDRSIDALFISFGGNEMGFSRIGGALTVGDVNTTSEKTELQEAIITGTQADWNSAYDELPLADFAEWLGAFESFEIPGLDHLEAGYMTLNDQIDDKLDVTNTYITEYPDFTTMLGADGSASTCDAILDDIAAVFDFPLLKANKSELEWLTGEMEWDDSDEEHPDGLLNILNDEVRDSAAANGWTYISGVSSDYQTHGWSSDDNCATYLDDYEQSWTMPTATLDMSDYGTTDEGISWIHNQTESEELQGGGGGSTGKLHPNRFGHASVAKRLFRNVANDLLDRGYEGRTGDLITMDLSQFALGSEYAVDDWEIPASVEDLTLVVDGSNRQLQLSSGETIATVIYPEDFGEPAFASSGVFYLAPSVEDALLVDSDGDSHGFQGLIQFNLAVTINEDDSLSRPISLVIDEDYSTSSDGPAPVTSDLAGENHYRLAQRLAYLGFRDPSAELPTPGIASTGDVTDTFRLFQATLDRREDGETVADLATPSEVSGALDTDTVNWLNSDSAPRWIELVDPDPQPEGTFSYTSISGDFDLLPGQDPGTGARTGNTEQAERFATDWIVDTFTQATADIDPDGILMNGLSTLDGVSSADFREEGDPGRLHRTGMEIDISVPSDAREASGDPGFVADEQLLVDLVTALDTRGTEQGIRIAEVVISNEAIVTHLNDNLFDGGTIARDHADNDHNAVM